VVSGAGNITGGHLTVQGDGLITGNLVVQGTTTSQNSNTITTNDLTITVGNNQSSGSPLNGGGLLVGASNIAKWQFNNLTTSWQSNISITPSANGTLSLGATNNYWGTAYISNVIVTGTTTTGSLATGPITSTGAISAAGNVTGSNIVSTNTVTANSLSIGGQISTTGTIIGATLSATGGVVATSFVGDGSALTGIASALSVGNSGNALVANTVSAGSFNISESAGILYFKYNGVNIATLDSAGNFTVKGNVTAFGTV
jgi:hypothetical protein